MVDAELFEPLRIYMKYVIGILLAGLILGVGIYVVYQQNAASRGAAPAGAAAGLDGSIRVGVALCMTGSCAEWGEGEVKAIQLAVEEANDAGGIQGRKLQLFVEDIEASAQGAVNAMKKLIDVNHVEAVLGVTWGDSFQAAHVINNNAHVVAVTPSGLMKALLMNNQPIEYTFSTWVSIDQEIDALQAYIQKNTNGHITIVHDEDPFARVATNTFLDNAASRGLTVDNEFKFQMGEDDFKTTIAKLKGMKVESVFLSFQSAAPIMKFLRQAHDLGYTPHMYSTEYIQDLTLLKDFGSVMEGVVYVYPEASGNDQDFQKKFLDRYHTAPIGPSAPNAYDAAHVVIEGLRKHYETGVDLKEAVQDTDLPGAFIKRIKFGTSHELMQTQFQIKTVKNGQFVVLQ